MRSRSLFFYSTLAQRLGLCRQRGGATDLGRSDAKRTPAGKFSLVTHNIAGGQFHSGGASALAPIRTWTSYHSADVIVLQEVCYSQALDLGVNGIPGYFPAVWNPTRTGGNCGADPRIGEYVLVNAAHAFSQWTTHFVGVAGSDNTQLACADFWFGSIPVKSCSTHLPIGITTSHGSAITNNIKNVVAGFINQGYAVAIGGDFNQIPSDPRMGNLYGIASGNMNEADQLICGSPCRDGHSTSACAPNGRKVDYVFFSGRLSNRHGGLSTKHSNWCSHSDHTIYQGLSSNYG